MDIFLLATVFLCLYKININLKDYREDYLSKSSTSSINGVFVLLVFMRHFFQYIEQGPLDRLSGYANVVLSQTIVIPFLFYSGYGIMSSIKQGGVIYVNAMPRKRIFRVWYHFVIAVVLFILVGSIMGVKYDINTILLAFLGWKSIGNSTWYIFSILMLYVFTYFSFKLVNNNMKLAIVLLSIFCVIYVWIMHYFKLSVWYNTVIMYPFGLLYSFYKKNIEKFVQKSNLVYSGCIIFLMITAVLGYYYYAHFVVYEYLLICFMLFLVILTMKVSVGNKMLLWLGNYTFEIYILQRIPMLIFQNQIANKYIYLFVTFVSTLILAIAFNKLIAITDKLLKLDSKFASKG